MKSILIQGVSHSGKSTTLTEVCKRLNPEKVWKLLPNRDEPEKSSIQEDSLENIFNNTFIIRVKGKNILVVAGSPTEQIIQITIIIEICIKINVEVNFIIASMRSFEKRENFDTRNELQKLSDIILEENIEKIPESDFKDHIDWKNRINKITNLILDNI